MDLINKAYYLTAEDGKETIIHKLIPQTELQVLLDYNEILLELRYYVRKLKEIELNYLNFISKQESYTNKLSKKADQSSEYFNLIYVDLNRLLVNFITSIKTLIEHLETKINRRYSKSSKEYESFKNFIGNCYDTYFSYRFLYHLRNFSIHTDFPINSFFADYIYDEIGGVKSFEFKVEFQKSHLLKDANIRKKLYFDLKSYNEKFPVKPILEKVLDPISNFLPFIINLDNNYYIKAAEFIAEYIAPFENKHDISISQWTMVNETTGKWSFKILTIELIDLISQHN